MSKSAQPAVAGTLVAALAYPGSDAALPAHGRVVSCALRLSFSLRARFFDTATGP